MTTFYYTITYWLSGPIAKWISPVIIHYIGISPIISPVCVELVSYAIIKPVHYFIVEPFTLHMYNKLLKNENDELLLAEYTLI